MIGNVEKEKEGRDALNVSCLYGLPVVGLCALDSSSDEVLSSLIQSLIEIGSYVDSFCNFTHARLLQ